MTDWLTRLRHLSRADFGSLAQALVLLPLTAAALRVVGFRRWQAALARWTPVDIAPCDGEEVSRQARGVARMVAAVARRLPWRATCLHQSLTLWYLLRRRGIDGELRIGVRKREGRFEAHAWVEWQGVVLNDGHDVRRRFSAFDRAILPLGSIAP